jgi:hypothetical protein
MLRFAPAFPRIVRSLIVASAVVSVALGLRAASASATTVTGTITPGGPAVTVTISTSGDNALLTFNASAGQRVSLLASNSTLSAYVAKLVNPSGATLANKGTYGYGTTYVLDAIPLSVTGTYSLYINPAIGATGSVTLTLYDVPPDFSGTITPGGPAVTVAATVPGHNPQLPFSAGANQRVSVAASGSTISTWSLQLLSPSGTALANKGTYGTGYTYALDATTLAVAGTYTLVVNPSGTATGSITITLYDVPPDVGGPITPNGGSVGVTTAVPGQDGRLTFTGTVGQSIRISASGSTMSMWSLQLLRPDGTTLANKGYYGVGNTLALNWTTLPVSGQYTIVVNPSGPYTGSVSVTLDATPGGRVTLRISGLANVGEEFVAPGLDAWTTPPPTSPIEYQWDRCDSAGASCEATNITTPTYPVEALDFGKRLRVTMKATNSYGSTTVSSPTTIPVITPVMDVATVFRPLLLFNLGNPAPVWDAEKWRPLEISNFLADVSSICTRQGEDPSVDLCELLTSPASQFASHDTDQGYLDHVADTSDLDACAHHVSSGALVYDCEEGPKAAIYLEPGQDTAAYRYLDYWFFYRDNHPDVTFGELDDHYGDWEGMTAVLDGLDPNAVSLAYVYYASHNAGQWYGANELASAGSLAADGKHAKDYVALGSHASYPTACSGGSCSTPSTVPWPEESDHDGLVPWGANDDEACAGTCVKRFTDDWWTYWHGHWGESTGWTNSFGWSPRSPGQQNRFKCAASGYDASCPLTRPPGARSPSSLRPNARVPNPRLCESWFGGSTSVLACDPKLLAEAIRRHRMRRPGKLHLFVNGRRAGDSPGLAQAIGEPLVPGARITFTGTGTRQTIIFIAARIGSHLYTTKIRYRDLGRASPIRLRLMQRNGRPRVLHANKAVPAAIRRVR